MYLERDRRRRRGGLPCCFVVSGLGLSASPREIRRADLVGEVR
jgi:hypothetical protein